MYDLRDLVNGQRHERILSAECLSCHCNLTMFYWRMPGGETMRVSINLTSKLVKTVDRLAKNKRKSRSKIIETLIESSLNTGSKDSRFETLVGAWKDDRSEKEIIEGIYQDRENNRVKG
ncbi:MAG: ribbon-helix-helix protein, CopG family [Nitrospirae bacterium]|nr:MAG: ribbon-helix-helix protein, CopG family [Nitrospirota bacterium]